MHHPLIPNYHLLELIGEGGYGLVYKAQQNNTGQLVAIKILKTNPDQDLQKRNHQKARFERETKLCAQINHPHIVQLLDKGYTNEGDLFAVFEYIAGQTLKDRIMREEGLPVLDTSILMGQVLDALVCAHNQGIVHRDLKPQNIMVTHTGATPHVKVLDFGIGAFTYEYRTQDYKSLTLTKEMIGTPSYSAPEQLRGEPPTIKSDIYAWGLIFVECLTGKTVVEGGSIAEIFQQQLQATSIPLPPAVLGHPVADLLRRVLDKNARTRSGSAMKLYEEYKHINFNTLVGKIAQQSLVSSINDDETQANEFEFMATGSTKRQVTMLCLQLSLILPQDCVLEAELLDSLQKDQLNICKDIALRYGGYIVGTFADMVGVYFGYPQVSDNDARRAGRTALELVSNAQKRSALLEAQYGISLDIRVSLHTGSVLTRANQIPEGLSLQVATRLLGEAKQHTILASNTARKLLDPYLEFGNPTTYHFPNTTQPIEVYALLGERQTEALSFLRPWSANKLMIGRDSEKQQVLTAWQGIQPGEATAILVRGQAGIGKSKLIYEAKKQLRSEGYLVRECRCLPEHTNNALFPFLDMLRKHWKLEENAQENNIMRLEEVLNAAKCEVKDTLPILCSWLTIPLNDAYEPSQATPEKQKEILLNTLEKLIIHLHQGEKFLLVVEDLHWLDPTSQEFLERLIVHLPTQNYLLLMTTRPYFQVQWSYAHLAVIELKPLAQGSVQHMVEEVLGGKPVAESLVNYIAKRADGVPLFVEELTRMLQEQEYLVLDNGIYRLDNKLNADVIPITLKDLLNARLDGLGVAKETAQLAATIGRNFDYDLLVKASSRDEASVQADLDQLMNADLIYRQRKVQNEGYIFRHALIKDAAYDGMTKALQKDTHNRIATTLEGQFPQIIEENPFEVARHFAGGERFNKAVKAGINSVDLALGKSLNQEAIRQSETILEWNKRIENEDEKYQNEYKTNEFLISACLASEGIGNEKSIHLKQRNEQITQKLNKQQEEAFSKEFLQFQSYYFKPDYKSVLTLGKKLLSGNKINSESLFVMVFSGHVKGLLGQLQEAIQDCNKAIELYDIARDGKAWIKFGLDPKCQALQVRGLFLMYQGYTKKAWASLDDAWKHAKSIGSELAIHTVIYFSALYAYHEQDKSKINQLSEKYYQSFRKTTEAHKKWGWIIDGTKCFHSWANGDLEFIVGWIDSRIALEQEIGIHIAEGLCGDILANNCEFESAVNYLTKAIGRMEAGIERSFLPKLYGSLASCLIKQTQKNTKKAQEAFEKGLMLSRQMQAYWLELEVIYEYHKALMNAHQPCEVNTYLDHLTSAISETEIIETLKNSQLYRSITTMYQAS